MNVQRSSFSSYLLMLALVAWSDAIYGQAQHQELTLIRLGSGQTGLTQSIERPAVVGDQSTIENPDGFETAEDPNSSQKNVNIKSNDAYTVQQIRELVGDVFDVAIVVNEPSGDSIELFKFELEISSESNQTIFQYDDGDDIENVNQGDEADAYLTGFNLSGFAANDSVSLDIHYHQDHHSASGDETFFLVSRGNNQVVPEPTSIILWMLGASISGVMFWWRQRAPTRNVAPSNTESSRATNHDKTR